MTVLEARGVSKKFGNLEVLRNVSLKVEEGETIVVMGPSGGGKSTFLRTLNQLESIDAGQILSRGKLVVDAGGDQKKSERLAVAHRRDVGMVFQQFNLFAHMTALENVAAGPQFALRLPKAECLSRAHDQLKAVDVLDKKDNYPGQLSGGQQQRVAIARALAMDPNVLLFDEPTSALDPEMVREVLEVMTQLAGRGVTMVVVSHELGFAKRAASRVAFMEDGEILELASPAEFFERPASARTERFLGKLL